MDVGTEALGALFAAILYYNPLPFFIIGVGALIAVLVLASWAVNYPRVTTYWCVFATLLIGPFVLFRTPLLPWRLEVVVRGAAIIAALLLLKWQPPDPDLQRPRTAREVSSEARLAVVHNAVATLVLSVAVAATAGFRVTDLGARFAFAPVPVLHAMALIRLRAHPDSFALGVGKALAVANLVLFVLGVAMPGCAYVGCLPVVLGRVFALPGGLALLVLAEAIIFLGLQLHVVRGVTEVPAALRPPGEYRRGLQMAAFFLVVIPVVVFAGLAL